MLTHANFDGSCEPKNPGGTGGWGYVIYDATRPDHELATGYGLLPASPTMTNNVAEYTAALECLRRFVALELDGSLVLRGDSKLVIEQMSGRWRVKAGHYIPVYREAAALVLAHRIPVRWEWVPRELNSRADELSKQGLHERGVPVTPP